MVLRTVALRRSILAAASLTSVDLLLQTNGSEVAVELLLLLGLRLGLELLLVDDGLLGLLVSLLNARLQPVSIIRSRLDILYTHFAISKLKEKDLPYRQVPA